MRTKIIVTEDELKKELNIPNFRHLSKEKLQEFISMLPIIDPELAKDAIKQFPHFAKTAIEVVKGIRSLGEQVLSNNKESMNGFMAHCDLVQGAFINELKKEDLTSSEREYILDKMMELVKEIREAEKENKKFINDTAKTSIFAMLITILLAVITLGGRLKKVGK